MTTLPASEHTDALLQGIMSQRRIQAAAHTCKRWTCSLGHCPTAPGQALRNQESIQNALSIMNLEADLHDLVQGIF